MRSAKEIATEMRRRLNRAIDDRFACATAPASFTCAGCFRTIAIRGDESTWAEQVEKHQNECVGP